MTLAGRLIALLTLILSFAVHAEESDTSDGLAELLRSDRDLPYARAYEPRRFVFPADHGPHPDYRNEWWYVTGNLDSDDGRRFGFELTIFRFALDPVAPGSGSSWATNQVYIAHFAVTDADGRRFYAAERYSRGAAGLAGAEADPFRVWIDDWQIASADTDGRWRLAARDAEFAVDLELEPLKAPVLNGDDGLSQKSVEAGNASYYYSMTRLATRGSLRVADTTFDVTGLSWLDREWSSSALGRDQQGWDWFALQLDDGSELMFYQLRRDDGSRDVHSGGTWTAADGQARKLAADDVDIEVLGSWQSPDGGAYPSGWRLGVTELGLTLEVEPVLADQELLTLVRYWEGAVDVRGTRDDRTLAGRGYVELTGYAD